MNHRVSSLLVATLLAFGATGCRCVEPEAEPAPREAWRQVYATPGTSESSRELIVWDFTDPDRPVAHVFSFQDTTFRTWKEVVLPSKPGTIWAGETDEEAAACDALGFQA